MAQTVQSSPDILQELYQNFNIQSHDHQEMIKRLKEIPTKAVIVASFDARKARTSN